MYFHVDFVVAEHNGSTVGKCLEFCCFQFYAKSYYHTHIKESWNVTDRILVCGDETIRVVTMGGPFTQV